MTAGLDHLADEELGWELPPLPPDPLGPDPMAGECDVEPSWLEHWLETEDVREEPPRGHLPGEVLAGVEPGLFLAGELEGTDPREVDEYHLVEMVAGYQRLAAWAQFRTVELAGRLARRPALNPRGAAVAGEVVMSVAAQELAPRLGISRFAAKRLVDNGRLFALHLEDTGVALREGRIDYAKACTIARLLKDQPGDVAWEVQQVVLPDAAYWTVTQLEREIARVLISIDPLRATARHRRAREQRRVHHPRPLPDGMASMSAVLPATDAAGLDLALEAAARAAKAAGDTRTIDQLRADALALLGHGALENGFVGVPTDQPAAKEAEPADTQPAAPEPEPAAEFGSGDGTDGEEAPVLETGNAFLRTPHMPIGCIGGRRAQIQVTVPFSVLIPFQSLAEERSRGDSPAHDQPPAAASGARPEEDVPEDYGLPEDWYFGPPVEVAELEGYGPITPDVARALAHSGGTWQRLVTDPLSGELLDVGRTRYRPPAPIADFVRNRDGTCVVPACSVPARSCQLDHVVPWQYGGVTSSENLGPLCTADHPTKSIGAFQLRHHGSGTFEWVTPTGHSYLRHRNGRVTPLRRGGLAASGAPRAYADEPPY